MKCLIRIGLSTNSSSSHTVLRVRDIKKLIPYEVPEYIYDYSVNPLRKLGFIVGMYPYFMEFLSLSEETVRKLYGDFVADYRNKFIEAINNLCGGMSPFQIIREILCGQEAGSVVSYGVWVSDPEEDIAREFTICFAMHTIINNFIYVSGYDVDFKDIPDEIISSLREDQEACELINDALSSTHNNVIVTIIREGYGKYTLFKKGYSNISYVYVDFGT